MHLTILEYPMIYSMTAFARIEQSESFGTFTWEIRSVNQRFLEPTFKMPEFARASEHILRENLRQTLSRGKIECSLRFDKTNQTEQTLQLNEALLQALLNANQRIAEKLPQAAAEQASTFLQWPGVIESIDIDKEQLDQALLASFQQALQQLLQHRQREGAELKAIIEQRLAVITDIANGVKQWLPDIIANQKQKLLDRFNELQLAVDPERIEQEIVFLAQKIDVDEELDRLNTHVKEIQNTLNKGGACGRRLDFLIQELNREANTLGSKSINSQTSQAAVDLKVAIEQMREQVQNIE
jgi:uncharacterized protein (TIGR00255 family)